MGIRSPQLFDDVEEIEIGIGMERKIHRKNIGL